MDGLNFVNVTPWLDFEVEALRGEGWKERFGKPCKEAVPSARIYKAAVLNPIRTFELPGELLSKILMVKPTSEISDLVDLEWCPGHLLVFVVLFLCLCFCQYVLLSYGKINITKFIISTISTVQFSNIKYIHSVVHFLNFFIIPNRISVFIKQ